MGLGRAAWLGHPEIAIGNVVGSNICNVGLILGLTALFYTIKCQRRVVVEQGATLLAISFSVWIYAWLMGGLGRVIGSVFLIGFALYIYMVFRYADTTDDDQEGAEDLEVIKSKSRSVSWLIAKMLILMVLLLRSSDLLVTSTIELARMMGVSEGVLALSMIALGTSLPELSVSIAAARKNQGDICIGNIFGSNVSNLLLVLGIAALIEPFPISGLTLSLDFPLMLTLSALMLVFLYGAKGISANRGIVLLCLYGLMILRCILLPK